MDDSHFNKNLPCTIAIKVTSDNPSEAELIEISVVPLNKNFMPSEDRLPITIYIRPDSRVITKDEFRRARYDYPTYLLAREKDLDVAEAHGVTQEESWRLFDNWFKTMRIGEHKRLIPVAYGYTAFYPYILNWLGYESYNDYFDWHYRDPFAIVSFDMDKAYSQNSEHRWRKIDLTSVLTCGKVEKSGHLDTMSQACDQAKLYKKLMSIV